MIYKTKRMPKVIVVDSDGDIITSANGQLSSDNRELVSIIKREVLLRSKVQLVAPFGQKIRANLDPEDLLGNTAALFSARPGRTRLLEAPPEVWAWLKQETITKSCTGNTSSGKDFQFKDMTDSDLDILSSAFNRDKTEENNKG
jgi:hypothetical protein